MTHPYRFTNTCFLDFYIFFKSRKQNSCYKLIISWRYITAHSSVIPYKPKQYTFSLELVTQKYIKNILNVHIYVCRGEGEDKFIRIRMYIYIYSNECIQHLNKR